MNDSQNNELEEGAAAEQTISQDHIALIHDNVEERLMSTVPLIKVGLEKGELCLYISDTEDDQEFVQALQDHHVDVEKAISTSGLILASKQEIYFKLGRFDPDWTIQVIKNVAELAISYGFTAMRIISDMRWTQDEVPGVERWPEYEVKLCTLDLGLRLKTICLYEREAFPPQALLFALKAHPKLVSQGAVYDNMFFISPERLEAGEEAAAELEGLLATLKAAYSAEIRLTSQEGELQELSKKLSAESVSRSAAEALLEENRSRLRGIVERSSEWIWELGPDGTYVYSSPRAHDLLGLAAEDVLGKRPEDLVDNEDASRIASAISQALSDGASISALEKKHRNREGHIVHLEMNGAPILDRNGNLQGYRGMDKDVTGRKASKKAIDDHRHRIEELTADLNDREIQLRKLEEEAGQLHGSIVAKENAAAALERSLKEKEAIASELAITAKEREEELSKASEALKEREAELSALTAALKEKEVEADRMAEEMSALRSEISSLTDQLQEAKGSYAATAEELDRQIARKELLRYNLDNLEANLPMIIAGYKERMRAAEAAAAEELEEQIARKELLRYNLDNLETSVIPVITAQYKERMRAADAASAEELAAVRDELSIRAEEMASVRAARSNAEAEAGMIMNRLRSLMSDIETVRKERDSIRDGRSTETEALRRRIRELETDLSARVDEVASVRAERSVASSEVGEIRNHLRSVMSEAEMLRTERDSFRMAKIAAEESLRTLTAELRDRTAAMEAELTAREEEMAGLRSKNDELTESVSELSDASDRALRTAAEVDALRSRLSGLEAEISLREEKEAALRQREAELIAKVDGRLAEVDALHGRIGGLEAELTETEKDLAGYRSREEGIKASLTSQEMEIGILKNRVKAMADEKALLMGDIGSRDKDIASLQVQLATVNAEVLAARNDQAALQRSLDESGRELKERRGQLRALLRQDRVGVARIDPDGRLIEANAAFHSLLGQEPGALAGAHYRDHTHRDDLADSADMYRRLKESGGSASLVKRYVRKHGGIATVSLILSPADGDGGAPYYMAMAFDRTEEVPEAALAMEAPSAGVAGPDLARRLNDALTVISGGVTLAKEYVIPEGRMYGQLVQIERASLDAARLAAELDGRAAPVSLDGPGNAKPIPGRGRVLLVDSDEAVLETTTHMLRHLGYDVDVARDGEEASAVCRHASEDSRAFALAIIDAGAPSDEEGRTIASRLMSENPGLRTMVSSGQASHPALTDPSEWGFEGALPRPYTLEGLSKAVGAALQGKA